MNESEALSYDLLYSILEQIPSAKKVITLQMTKAEMIEVLRLNSFSIYESFQDFSMAYESLNFIASDYQLRLKAEDIWKQQLEVFRGRIQGVANSLSLVCKTENIDIEENINEIINY